MLKRYLALIAILLTVGTAHAMGTGQIPAINSLLFDGVEIDGCTKVNGLLWCHYPDGDPDAIKASCNQGLCV